MKKTMILVIAIVAAALSMGTALAQSAENQSPDMIGFFASEDFVQATGVYVLGFHFPADRPDVFFYEPTMAVEYRVGPIGPFTRVPAMFGRDLVERYGVCPGINWTINSDRSLEWKFTFTAADVLTGIEVRLVNSDGHWLGAPCYTIYQFPPP